MKSKKKLLATSAIVLAILLAAAYIFFYSPLGKKTSVEALSYKVERGDLSVSITGTGAVIASVKDDITAKKAGVVKVIYKNEDDTVKAGDLIMELKDDDININIEDTMMNIKNLQRELDNRIKDKNNQLVKAPIDGIITDINVEEGDLIKSSTIIANITNYSKYKLMVPFLFSQLEGIKAGQKCTVSIQDYMSSIEGVVTNVANYSRPGPFGKIYGDVEIEVPNPGAIKADTKAGVSVMTGAGEIYSQETSKLEVFKKTSVKFETTRSVSVSAIKVKENDFVSKGQLLLELNDDSFENDVENLKSRLYKANLQLQTLNYQKENLKIFATINGTISRQKINVEDGINMSQVISSISDYSKMEFSIPVDELDISKIQLGMKADVTVDALPGKVYKGEVSKIANEGTSQNGVATYLVTVKILDPKGLKVGMSANAQIILKEKKGALMLRMAAVQQYNKSYYVIPRIADGKVQDPKDPSKVTQKVEVGINNKDYIEIVGGLKEGDEVISPRPAAKSTSKPAETNPLNVIKK